jgi:iron complex transport system substrate-binding protein
MPPILKVAAISLLLCACPLLAESSDRPARLVSVDAAATEIIYALGGEERLVGVDTTSLYPAGTEELAKVGYKRALSAEGILSLGPDLLLATDEAGPPEVLEQVARAGVAIRRIPDTPTVAGLHEKIAAVAEVLGRPEAGAALSAQLDQELARLDAVTEAQPSRPRVLFLLHVGAGNDLAAGRDTAADTVIRLAGGQNVLHDDFSGYKPLSAEAALAAAPDVILVTQQNLEQLGSLDAVLERGALKATPAGQARRVLAMNGPLLLAFGPRLAVAAAQLACDLGISEADLDERSALTAGQP